ncbi:MAG: hypothetical protein H6918_09365 [Sphingomonadaceae bacterium]|nr:hypothetical protein [Sphingomonadaceae bacterium]
MSIQREMELRQATSGLVFQALSPDGAPYEPANTQDYLQAVVLAAIVADESRAGLGRWVSASRRAGASWSEIGDTLGISKQAAQQRFSQSGDPLQGSDDIGNSFLTISGAHAFNEMGILRDEGEKGRELVRIGMLTLTFRQTPDRWEYRRITGGSEALEREGWQFVAGWFPFRYYKRIAE